MPATASRSNAPDAAPEPSPDVEVSAEGTVLYFALLTARARGWVRENVRLESWQTFGSSFVSETRYGYDIVEGMESAGLVVV